MKTVADRVRAALALLGPLGAGSRVLLLRLVARFGWRTVAIGALVALFALNRYRTWIAWMIAAWAVAAWMHVPDDKPEQAPADAEEPCHEDAEEETGEQPAEPPADPFPDMVWGLIGDAPGVHIKHIVEWLHETGLDTTCTAREVKAGLTRRGIPIRASVRDGEQRVNQGVHRADLTAWLEARSPTVPAPVAEARSNTATTPVTSVVADPATGVATSPTPSE
jgi:hypothetical protein